MTLAERLSLLISAIGADIKSLRTNSEMSVINAATHLIQTQKIMAQMALRNQL